MICLKDIAKECGLSMTQVSRALNNHKDVSKKTKKLVKETAEQLGYVKNINAQILATKDSNQIALIICGIDNDENSEPSITYNIIKGVNRYAKENKYEAVVHLNEDKNLSYLSFCRQRGLMGAILFGADFEDKNLKDLVDSDFPCVVIDIPIEGNNKGCIVVNNIYYSMTATQNLVDLGKKNIAMLTGHGRSIVEVERRMGYEMALSKSGNPVNDKLIINADFDTDIAYEKTLELLATHSEIDGIFCASDFMAIGAINAIKDMNLKIPQDIAVFGFDGITLGQYSTPTLSTIRQDNLRKGYSAARLLCDILNNKHNENTVVVPCEVVLRQSTNNT